MRNQILFWTFASALVLAAFSPRIMAQGGQGPAVMTYPTTIGHCLKIADRGGGYIADAGAPCGTGGGSGTVSSFSAGNAAPVFSTSVATPTTTPALTFSLTLQGANTVFAGPTSGGNAAPTFRALVAGDVPTLNQSTTGNAATATALAANPTDCSANQYATAIDAGGNLTCAQPSSGQITGLGTAATVNTGTSGATIPLLNGANTWSAAQVFSASAMTIGADANGSETIKIDAAASTNRLFEFDDASVPRFKFGVNASTAFFISAYDGTGTLIDSPLSCPNAANSICVLTRAIKTPGAVSTGTKFTTSGCSVSATTGGATAGTFTLGANSCSVVVTMDGATGLLATNGWSCQAHDRTAPTILLGGESASTTATATFTIPVTAGATDVISFACVGY